MKFLIAFSFPVCGLVMSVAAFVLYRRLGAWGALLISLGFGISSLSVFGVTIVGKILMDGDPFNEAILLIYQTSGVVTASGVILATGGFLVLSSQSKSLTKQDAA